ncbi:hypothetical protein BRC99_01065 [Halobacteriales archaeon QS_7_69_60]|nr:MAG: hypothetical protein BRC99_01065 [Halobacteriales archaeon QS_7_69_60]
MADEQGTTALRELTNTLTVLLVMAGLLFVVILGNAPTGRIAPSLFAIFGVYTAISVALTLHVHRGGRVLGEAGIYPVVAGAAVAVVLFLLVFTDAPSQYLTVVALGGIAAVSVAGGVAFSITH